MNRQENTGADAIAQARLAAIVDSSYDAIIGKDLNGIVTSWNRSAERIFGYTAAEMTGSPITRLIPENRRDEEERILGMIARGEKVESFETVRRTCDGRDIEVSVTVSPIRDAGGKIVGASKILRDITQVNERAREVVRLSRLYGALSQVNQAIVRIANREELTLRVCEALVHYGAFHMAWFGRRDAETHRLMPVAAWGDEPDYPLNYPIYTDERPEGGGPSGRAFRTGRPSVCRDIQRDPSMLPWREPLAQRGIQASAAFPIVVRGAVELVLSVYGDSPAFFHDKEVALLEEAASDVAFALENMAREEARLEAETTLRHERDFSDAVINSLPGVFYMHDREGRMIRWNRNLERVSGRTAAEIAGLHPLEFFAGPDKEQVEAWIKRVFESGAARVEAAFASKLGTVVAHYLTGTPIRIDGSTALLGVGINITERRRAEEAERRSEARFHTLFEHSPDGIVVWDRNMQCVEANPSICWMLGYPRQELLGKRAAEVVSAAESKQITPTLSAVEAGSFSHREWAFRRRDGSHFPAEVIAARMPAGNVLAMIRDITDRRRAESERERMVRAEAADRVKSAFLATMSHELRTPLNSIIGFTGILLQGLAGPLNAEQNKQLGMVRNSARHLLALINDVLDISKIEAGQLNVARDPFDIALSIGRAVDAVRPLAEKKGLGLRVEIASDLGTALNDARRFEQILLNLLSNGVKFTERGEVSLTAEGVADLVPAPGAQPQPGFRVEVSDTGIGIRPEDLATLFQPFRQVDTALSRNYEGTGLGLAICRRLANLMGGEVYAESVWGEGSTFSLTLPIEGPAKPAPTSTDETLSTARRA